MPALGFEAGVPCAAEFDRAALRTTLDELEAAGLVDCILAESVAMDRAAHVSLVGQTAFVSGYGVVRSSSDMAADPTISIARDGARLQLRSSVDVSQPGIEAELVATQLCRPVAVAPTPRLFLWTEPLKLQLPIYVNERVSSRSDLGDDRVLVIGGIADSVRERVFFALVRPAVTLADRPRTAAIENATTGSPLANAPAIRSAH